jgi:hypothetical protein
VNVATWVKTLLGVAPPPAVPRDVPAVFKLGKSLVYSERDGLTREEAEMFCTGKCPDCGASLLAGPEAGFCQNVLCESDSCASKFNYMGPFGIERLTDASPKKTLERRTTYRS